MAEGRRHLRAAPRWLQRYLEEYEATLGDVALVVGALGAVTGERREAATRLLQR